MKTQLDNFDHKIIQALTGNARISITDLSHHVNLSRNAVTNRISKLEKSGFIKGYTAILGDGLTDNESVNRISGKYSFKHLTD